MLGDLSDASVTVFYIRRGFYSIAVLDFFIYCAYGFDILFRKGKELLRIRVYSASVMICVDPYLYVFEFLVVLVDNAVAV